MQQPKINVVNLNYNYNQNYKDSNHNYTFYLVNLQLHKIKNMILVDRYSSILNMPII